ncbi:MAG: C40 family peptidase [Actinobacteria bacterium]|nr:C40 family peptidase [Actinomycetota bacterium]
MAWLCAAAASAAPPSHAIRVQRAREHAVIAQIDRIGASLESTIQEYDGARIRLARVRANLRANEYALGVARTNLHASQVRLERRLVELYMHGQPGALDVLAGAKSLSDLIDRVESAKVLTQQDSSLARATLSFTQTVQQRERLLKRQRAERAATVARLASRRRTIEGALAQQRRLLASIHTTIRAIQAREAAAAAAHRREVLREIAAAKAAAEARAQAAANTPDQQPQDAGAASALPPSPAPVTIAPSSGGGHPQAASLAAQYLGVPYVWGGASPGGFDCSGLVMYVYAQLGISLPHYTVSQWNATIPVAPSDMQPGDLVFFDGLGHVGIYIGNGQFIDAPHTGSVVRVDSLSNFGGFDGARRVP